MDKKSGRIIAISVGFVLWLFYIFQRELATYGIYTLISFQMHEVASVIPAFCTGVTICWLVYYFYKKVHKTEKKFILFLCVLLIVQGYMIQQESLIKTKTALATIEKIDRNIILAEKDNGDKLILKTPQLVFNLLDSNSEDQYLITYEYHVNNQFEGRLCMISLGQEDF